MEHDDGDSDDDPVSSNAEDPVNKELNSVKGFLHEILRNQILVGDVYLRPFVDQEDRLNGLNINKFTKDLLDHRDTKSSLNLLGYQLAFVTG